MATKKSCSNCLNCDEYDERCQVHNMPLPRDEKERTRFAKTCLQYEDVEDLKLSDNLAEGFPSEEL